MRVAFFGTPDFAVPSLNALVEAGHDVVGVFTQPERAAGRGMKPRMGAVSSRAGELGLPLFQFEKVRRSPARETLASLQPDVMVSAAFGQIFSQKLLDIPRLGCVNVHASLLPRYRGSCPIQWAVINGETTTGITTMLTDAGVDTGDILLQRTLAIGERETAGQLFERLAKLGAETLIETLALMETGQITPIPQDHSLATHCAMLDRQTGKIDWNLPPLAIVNLVRGVNPWPGAWCSTELGILKVWQAAACEGTGKPGEVLDCPGMLVIACHGGAVRLEQVQLAGKRAMSDEDLLRGHNIVKGSILNYGD